MGKSYCGTIDNRKKDKKQCDIHVVSNCKHYVKNWDSKRDTYLCSSCGKDFTDTL